MTALQSVGEWLVIQDDNRKPSAYIRRDDIVAIEPDPDMDVVDGYVSITVYLRGQPGTFFEGWIKADLLA